MAADLSFPIGRYAEPAVVTPELREQAIEVIAALPARVREAVHGLSETQLDTPYRPGGWTVRQLVHHIADSHMNAYLRLKLALTETNPTIKPYDQELSATLADSCLPVEESLSLLDGLHSRWTALWRSLTPEQFSRTFNHPEIGRVGLDGHLQTYAWHSQHHVAHITEMRRRLRI